MKKLIRITTIPLSLEKLLENQLAYMSNYYEVTAVASDSASLEEFGRNQGVATFSLALTRKITPIKDLKAVYHLYKYLKSEQPHIVHTHTPKAGVVGMIAARLAKVPHRLHTVAGLPLLETSGFKRIILNQVEKLTYRCATKVYPNSKGLKNIIIDNKFTVRNKLKIIGKGSSNGIDTTFFSLSEELLLVSHTKREELSIPESDFVFIFVGRVVSDKGINELVTAFTKLSKDFSKCSLLLVGPIESDLDPLFPETLEEIQNHPKIYTTGYVDDVRPYFAFAKALVFPSYREGFPNVVLQAGAIGLPSIVSNINGCNEIIIDNCNGIIVPVKNSHTLFEAMKTYVSTPELCNKHASNARKMIVSNYERSEIWDALLFEYKSLSNF